MEGAGAPRGLAWAWRSITLSVLTLAGVMVFAALIVTLGEANYQRDRALAAQRHSYDVMILARTLQGTIARSEASLGRYVISGDQQLGRLYYEDWRRADETITRLEKLTRDDAVQSRHLRDLRVAFEARGNELALTALNTNYGRNSQALSRYYQNRQGASLATINAVLTALISDERDQLEARTTQAMTSVKRSTTIAKVLAVFGIILVLGAIAMGWLTLRALTDRALARAEADTERRRADDLAAAVAKATAELRIQEARLRQVQKMEAVGKLTGGIAHDFNNMLSVVLGGLELARRHAKGHAPELLRHLDSAHDGARRAAALTGRLLSFARETAINPELIGAEALFGDLADLLQRTLGDGITVAFRDSSHGWRTRVDRGQLENALVNLAVNARDAMDGRGHLTLVAGRATLVDDRATGRAAGDFLTLAVSDDGCGIAPDVLERVFEPFFTTKPVGKGTGLGLSQIFSFARQAGGDVTITSTPGDGTTVTLFLPRETNTATQGASQAPAITPVPLTPQVAHTHGRSILVVEDDPRVLTATMAALTELGHFPVACDDPVRAAAMLAAMPAADLILSDVLMPTLNGPEWIAALPPHLATVPVLFVTGFAGEVGAIDLRGHPVLRKPFTLAALDRALTAAIARVAEQPAPASSAAA